MREGWQILTIGETCELVNGGTPKTGVPEYWDGKLNWITPAEMGRRLSPYVGETQRAISELGLQNSSARMLPPYSVILSSRAPIGHLVINTAPMATNQGCKGLIPKSTIQYKFLYYYLYSIVDLLDSLGTGTTFRELSGGKLKDVDIPVPPLPEQQRIVALLDEAFAGLASAKANAERNLQNTRALFEGALNSAIQGELIPQDSSDDSAAELIEEIKKARYVAITQGRARAEKSESIDRDLDSVIKPPRGWALVLLESLAIGISDGVHKKPHYVSTGVPFITVKNLTAGAGISFDDLNYISREDHDEFIKRTHPEKGDILVTKDGTIGVVRLIDTDVEFSIFVSVALIKPVMKELAPYLVYALRASCVQSQIVPQGAALKHLYLVDLRRLVIPLPPLREQKIIVESLDALSEETHRLTSLYERKLAALEELKKSLLHQAFNGEL
jgi:type I restriction enzyme, S subunit